MKFEREFKENEIFLYLGKQYKLRIIKDKYEEVYIDDDKIIVKVKNTEKEYIQAILKWWYKRESEIIVSKRIDYLKRNNEIMKNLTPKIVKVKEQKKRWGSCTSEKNIYINSKISMARISSIDYILVHEFSHLVHMNHSKDFYSLVKKIMPNYTEEENWLKENSYNVKL